jgi:hypothetical protein
MVNINVMKIDKFFINLISYNNGKMFKTLNMINLLKERKRSHNIYFREEIKNYKKCLLL